MRNGPATQLIMKELQSMRMEMAELKNLSIKQSAILEKMGIEVKVEPAKQEQAPEITYTQPEESFDYKISSLLQELRIPASIKGYPMLREAIKLVSDDPKMMRVTKYLYPELASRFNTTAHRAERAIRHAITISYDKNYYHPLYQRAYQDSKPSNAQFIATIVDKFKLEEQSKELVRVGI